MFLLIARNFRHRRLRSWLTILGIVIATTLILELNFLGDGMRRAVEVQMRNFGGDILLIFPGKEDNPFAGMAGQAEIRDRDVRAIGEVDGVRFVVPMQTSTVRMDSRGDERAVLLHGSPWRETRKVFEESRGFGLAEGAWPESDEAAEVILGSELAAARFDRPVRTGDILNIGGRRFTVAGVFKRTGDSNDDSMAYVSLERWRRITGDTTGVRGVIAKLGSGADASAVAQDVKERLLEEKGVEDFVVLTPEKALRIIGDVLGVIRLVLGGIAAISLLVGGVGIMNTMFTSVLERTREIGVLKALGATDRRVLSLFLVESGMLGAVGGLLGVALSAGIAKAAEAAARSRGFVFLDVAIDPTMVAAALAVTFILGMAFGAFPAWQAARLKPTDALRYE